MMRFSFAIACLLEACSALSAINRKACQQPTRNPLDGCPKNTILVGPGQKYSTVQSAILSLPNNTAASHILVLPGNYTEQVNVTRSGPVYLFGQTKYPNDQSKNTVNIVWRNATGAGIIPNIDTPFGNTDFRAYNLNFVNDYRPYSAGPSLAVSVSYANTGFYFCGFYSYQDTVSYYSTIFGARLIQVSGVHWQAGQCLLLQK
jgi:pectin methylesterase-like acyl-CoA thioesterase